MLPVYSEFLKMAAGGGVLITVEGRFAALHLEN